MSSFHVKLEEGDDDYSDDDHGLSKEINKEVKDDDHREEKGDILQEEIKEETKNDHQEERENALLEEIKEEKEIKQETKDDHQEVMRDNVLGKEIKEAEQEADQKRLLKKQKKDDDDDDDYQIPSSYYEKLKKVDDGSFDEMLKKIALQTDDKEQRVNLLTETVLPNFIRKCAENADKDRQETKLKPSEEDLQTIKNYVENIQADSEPVLVIQKRLTDSDLNDDWTDQSGLAIPKASIIDHQFLSEQEIEKIDKEGELMVTLVEIVGYDMVMRTNMKLKNMGTDYVLTGKWNIVKRSNEKRFRRANGVNADIQLLSFRKNSYLHFTFFVLEEEP